MSYSLPQIEPRHASRNSRRRAAVLIVVHVLVALHVAHFWWRGETMSPLEPSEAGYTISSGAINAGAIFLVLLIGSTLVFGRFFCGWACHVVAYQDAARWVLRRFGLRPDPVRSRALMLVPLFAVYWLYGRPLIDRLREPADSGVSWDLMTTDFWETFPGWEITALTFGVCGAVIVYVMGAKGFCTYGCPYGALFGVADEFAPGRIRVNEACTGTGHCTDNCSSNVDVAREVEQFGMVVDPGCLKCMDCVAGCPNEALSFSFAPATARVASRRSARPPRLGWMNPRSWFRQRQGRHDLHMVEECLAIVLFAGMFATTYFLYRTVPFLLAVGLSVVLAYVFLTAIRLVCRRDVAMQGVKFKHAGRVSLAGVWYLGFAVILSVAVAHSGWMKWNSWVGTRAFSDAASAMQANDQSAFARAKARAIQRFDVCRDWGAFRTRGSGRMMGELHRWSGDYGAAVEAYEREMEARWTNTDVPLLHAIALYGAGDRERAGELLSLRTAERVPNARQGMLVDTELRRLGADTALRIKLLDRSFAESSDPVVAMRLMGVLVQPGAGLVRDVPRAIAVGEQARQAAKARNAILLSGLARLYALDGRLEEALEAAKEALTAAAAAGDAETAREVEALIERLRDSIDG